LLPGKEALCYELLSQPLHEELYRRQSFDFLDILTPGQRLLLSYDYVATQVEQGGFIQLLVNGYVGLLPEMPALLQKLGAEPMAALVDDVLKAYVTHHAHFKADISTQAFAALYSLLPEFSSLDARFRALNDETVTAICNYAKQHLDEFVTVVS